MSGQIGISQEPSKAVMDQLNTEKGILKAEKSILSGGHFCGNEDEDEDENGNCLCEG